VLTIKTTGLQDYLDPASGQAWVQCLIIGGHGVGKTPFAAKWPKPIFAMAEHGTMSIAKDNLPYGEIYSPADMDAFIDVVKKDSLLPIERRQFLTVVLDTVDSYQKRLMDQRVVEMGLDRFTGWDNWDWLDAKVSKVLRALSNLPIHLVVNMHYKQILIGEGEDKTVDREAKLKGDMKTTIYQEFDFIGFMETYYTPEGGERVRKHRIRWWPEPGYEMCRTRAVGNDGVLLPQFTPVDFKPSDFQVIFDHIAAGTEGLRDAQVIEEVATETDHTGEVPTPNQGAGPVSSPSLPPAARTETPKEPKPPTITELMERVGDDPVKAQQMLEWEQTRGDGNQARPSFVTKLQKIIDSGTPEPVPDTTDDLEGDGFGLDAPEDVADQGEVEEVHEEPESIAESIAADTHDEEIKQAPATTQNGRGTAEVPVELDEKTLNNMDGPKYAALDHVHSPGGKCLKNMFVEPGEDGKRHCPLVEGEADDPLPVEDPPEEQVAAAAVAEESQPHPSPAAPETPPSTPVAPPSGDVCGAQPQQLQGKYEPVAGCGRPLDTSNKAPLAVVKFKTMLCTECFASHQAAA
jgi:hypothetical protein